MIKIIPIQPGQLNEYSKISGAFKVSAVLRINHLENGLNGIKIYEENIANPFIKDYDKYEKPTEWKDKWNLENWGLFVAQNDTNETIGGVVIAYDTPEIHMLEGRKDLTVLWDIRVQPEYRGKGIGKLLFNKAVEYTKEKNCKIIKIETQNNNVDACEFYSKQGCCLEGIHYGVYKEFPDEIQLLWYKRVENDK
ncbi:MAG: GNAT family N-acetyltransferase [bacterium]|nr:GNAT family N-acetyltransferase [bacterium]